MLKKSKKGFTLIELLVVIAILGLLASFIFIHLKNTKASGRDAKRNAELDALRKSLTLYYEDNREYPAKEKEGEWVCVEDTIGEPGEIAEELRPYLSDIPQDPLYNKEEFEPDKTYGYYYAVVDEGQGYEICSTMERENLNCFSGYSGSIGVDWGKGGPGYSWSYKLPITITENSGNNLTNYQVPITIDTASLINNNKMELDCSDIMFTESDGITEIPFWLESGCNTAATEIWVKAPSLPAGLDTTIYMYYGYVGASSKSNYAATFPWIRENIETIAGGHTSIALDNNNYPHVVYEDYNTRILRYAKWNGAYWNATIVDDTVTTYHSGLALDNDGNAHIYYHDTINNDLRYAKWNGTNWEITTVDSEGRVGRYGSIALNANNYPHIIYAYNYNEGIKHAWYDGAYWQTEFVDDSAEYDSGYTTSITVDKNNNILHVSYLGVINWPTKVVLLYAKKIGGNWTTSTVDTTCDYTSIALDSNNNPRIAYYDTNDNSLRYAFSNDGGNNWTTTTVETFPTGTTSYWLSLTIDSNDYPHISYQYNDGTDRFLKYTKYNGANWEFETEIDPNNDSGWNSSLALDAENFPHISFDRGYYSGVDHNIKHAYQRKYINPEPEVTYSLEDEEKL